MTLLSKKFLLGYRDVVERCDRSTVGVTVYYNGHCGD